MLKKIFLFSLFILGLAQADTMITGLPPIGPASVGSNDVFPIVNLSLNETAKFKLSDILSIPSLQNPVFTGNVSAASFTGPLFGNATTATTVSSVVAIALGGTGQVTKGPAFNALSPMTTLGDIIYGGSSGTGTRLSGNTTATKKFLNQTGTGSVSAAPAWGTIANTDLSGITNTQLSGSAAITNANLATMVNGTVKGNVSGITAKPSDLTSSDLKTLLGNITWNAQTSSYALLTTDSGVGFTTSASTLTATLPTAVGASGQIYAIGKVDSGAGTVAINTTSSQTVGGIATGVIILTRKNDFIMVESDNANWQIINTALWNRAYVSTGVSTNGTLTSTTYTTFTNAPVLTFTPVISGQYKIYGTYLIYDDTLVDQVGLEIIATSGSPTLVALQVSGFNVSGVNYLTTLSPYAIYELTAGTSYSFTVEGKGGMTAVVTLVNAQSANGQYVAAQRIM